jgi:hypothetical protein
MNICALACGGITHANYLTGTHVSADVREALIRYLYAHPESCDTLQGVMQWWLRDEAEVWSRAEVECALRSLVSRSLVTETKGADGQIRYSLHRRSPE